MNDLTHFYQNRKNEFIVQLNRLQKDARHLSYLRTITALVFVVVFYLGFSNTTWFYGLIPLALLFGLLVSRHSKVRDQSNLVANLVLLNEQEKEATVNNFSFFKDGTSFSNPDHHYTFDLDVFGKGSLFQYLNRCGCAIGEQKLAEDLKESQPQPQIKKRQEAVAELAPKIGFRQQFWALGKLIKDDTDDNQELFNWLDGADFVYGKKSYLFLLFVAPAIAAALIALTVYNSIYFPLLMLSMGVQLTITAFHSKKVSDAERSLTRYMDVLNRYGLLLKQIGNESFASAYMKELQLEAREASGKVRIFSRLVNAFESRRNAIAYGFGNSFYLYDLQSLYRLEGWRKANGRFVKGWIEKIAEADALNSFATFHFNNPANTFPEIDSALSIEGEEVGHPLIAGVERIANSFSLGSPNKVMLITGANMAGKSTFLRTVGVNTILALAGSSVCARSFRCPMVTLLTSMRATDSLLDHQSYFYAELNRIKKIMEEVRTGKPTLVLLDEILRGTNSSDKQSGSIGLLVQFVSLNALVILASHDIALGELEKKFPDSIKNYCFESEIKESALSFDYTLHRGVAHRANATFLMRKMGILSGEDETP